MSHGGKRPGSGAKPKGDGGKNMSLRLYAQDRERIALYRSENGYKSDADAVRAMLKDAQPLGVPATPKLVLK